MSKGQLTQEQKEALGIILEYCAADLATVVALHETGCFLRAALDIVLEAASMTKDQLLEAWVAQAMTSE